MRIRIFVVCLVTAAIAAVATAQTKISGTLSCAKADPMNSIETGDGAGTVMNLVKVQCKWTKGFEMAGLAAKDGYSVAASEMSAGKTKDHGIHVGTMANGDKYYVHFQSTGTVKPDHSGTSSGTWTFEGGTGKLKGLTGKGTYKGTNNADGTGGAEVEGEYSVPK
jgi:hypothetical protein